MVRRALATDGGGRVGMTDGNGTDGVEHPEEAILRGKMARSICRCVDGDWVWGWQWAEKVGPHLPQRAMRWKCANCGTQRSQGVVYR